MKKNKDPKEKLLKLNKNPVNNYINRQKFKIGRVRSQENIYQQNRPGVKSLNNKNFPINIPITRNIILRKNIRKLNKNSFSDMNYKNKCSAKRKINLINSKASNFNKKIFPRKVLNLEHENGIRKRLITNNLYDDIKIRNIIKLWNELEVIENYRKYFFFIYKELGEEDKDNLYNNEINELIQLKNDIKNLGYNIELRIGIIQKLYELNEKLNKENEKGETNKHIIDEMYKKLKDLTIQTVNIIQYMKKIKLIINILPNLGKYDLDNIAQKFDFDKNYVIKMKFEADFLREGCAKKFFEIRTDQSPFIVKVEDKKNNLSNEEKNNKVIFLDEKIINDMKDCDYFIYKELISYENEKTSTRFRSISPIRKNTSAYNFYTNINFYTSQFIKKKDSRNEKINNQLNKNKKEIINNLYNNSALNIKKDNFFDQMNRSERFTNTMNLFNYDNSNINRYKNRVSQLIDKKNQIYSRKLNTNKEFVNYPNKFNKNELINPIINNSETFLLKANEDLKLKDPILPLNTIDISENNKI